MARRWPHSQRPGGKGSVHWRCCTSAQFVGPPPACQFASLRRLASPPIGRLASSPARQLANSTALVSDLPATGQSVCSQQQVAAEYDGRAPSPRPIGPLLGTGSRRIEKICSNLELRPSNRIARKQAAQQVGRPARAHLTWRRCELLALAFVPLCLASLCFISSRGPRWTDG